MRLFIVFVLSILLFSCSEDGDLFVGGPDQLTNNYYPLSENNSWVYDLSTFVDGNQTFSGEGTVTLGSETVIDGITFYSLNSNSNQFLGILGNPSIGRKDAVSYLRASLNTADFNLGFDYSIAFNQAILDENSAAGEVFDLKEISFNTGSINADLPEMTMNVSTESTLIESISSIDLTNGFSYSNIKHSQVRTSLDLVYRLEDIPPVNIPVSGVQVTINIIDQDINILENSEVLSWDFYFAKNIGLAKVYSELDPSNLSVSDVWSVDVVISTPLGNLPQTTLVLNFDTRTAGVQILGQSVNIPFEIISPELVTFADYFDTFQNTIDELPSTENLAELKAYEVN